MGSNEDEEYKKWQEEQKKIKNELQGLLTDDVKEDVSDDDASLPKSEDEALFEKAMAKVTGEEIPEEPKEEKKGDIFDDLEKTKFEGEEEKPPEEPKAEEPPPEPEAMKEEPPEEPKAEEPPQEPTKEPEAKPPEEPKEPTPPAEPEEEPPPEEEDVREIPKPKGLAEKLGKVMAHEKGEKLPEEPEVREIPKPKGLMAKLGKVLDHEKKPDSEKKAKKMDISKFAAADTKKAAADDVPPPEPPTDEVEEGVAVPKSPEETVNELIVHTEGLIEKAPEHIDLSRPKKLIRKAKDSLEDGESEDANKLAQEAREKIVEIRNDFINAKKLLKQSKDRLLGAKAKGFNISKAKSHYQMALKLLKKNDHIMSMQYAKLCLREIERNEMGI